MAAATTAAVVAVVAVTAGAVVAHDRQVKQNRRIGEAQDRARKTAEAQERAAQEEFEADKKRRDEFLRRSSQTGAAGIDNNSNLNRPSSGAAQSFPQTQGRNRLLGS